jgi:DNA-binding beta-propeller fold protein YncE
MKRLLGIAVLVFGTSAMLLGQTYTIKNFAGVLPPTGTTTQVNNLVMTAPDGVVVDSKGNMFVTDTNGHKLWKVDPTGVVTLVAGTGAIGDVTDGKAANTQTLNQPSGLAMDAKGNLFVSDRGNSKIYKIDTSGVITRFASVGNGRFSGDGRPALNCELNSPRGMTFGPDGNLYVADRSNNRIRKIDMTSNVITTVAGGGSPPTPSLRPDGSPCNGCVATGDGGLATQARLSNPEGVTFDANGTMWIADTGDNRIRSVTKGIIQTMAGRDLTYSERGLDPSGNPVKDPAANANLKGQGTPYPTVCSRPATSPAQGCATIGDGNNPMQALLASPAGIAVDANGNIVFTDRSDNRIRMLNPTTGTILTLIGRDFTGPGTTNNNCTISPTNSCGDGGIGKSASLNAPSGLFIDSAGVYWFTDMSNNRVRVFDPAAGIIKSVTGFNTFNGDQAALSTQFSGPVGIVTDAAGNVYVADSGNGRIRKIDTGGNVTTIAGGGNDSKTDGIPPTSAAMSGPSTVWVDPTGALIYVIDTGNNKIRKISGGSIVTVAGGGSFKSDGLPATSLSLSLNSRGNIPSGTTNNTKTFPGLTVGSDGTVYFAEPGNAVIRKIQGDQTVVTIAGTYGSNGGAGDGGPATQALLNNPTAMTIDNNNNIFFSDTNNHVVRVVTGGIILPFAGEMGSSNNDSTTSAVIGYDSRLRYPQGVALDAAQANLFMASAGSNDIMKESLTTLMNQRVAGNNNNSNSDFVFDFSGDGTAATSAQLSYPTGLATDAKGNVYVTDAANNLIRVLVPGK